MTSPPATAHAAPEKPNLTEEKDRLAVMVSSYDGMDDLWGPFWALFFRFWPDCPYDVYLIANHKKFEDGRVTTITVGDDKGWARNLRFALDSIPHRYVLYLQEDYLLTAPVSSDRIVRISRTHRTSGAVCTSLYPRYNCRIPYAMDASADVVDADTPFRVSLQAAIWDKQAFAGLLRDDESQWQFEYRASKEAQGLILTDRAKITVPSSWAMPYFVTAVVRGKWVPAALELCRIQGIPIDRDRRATHRFWKLRHLGAHVKWYFRFGRIPAAPESEKQFLPTPGSQ